MKITREDLPEILVNLRRKTSYVLIGANNIQDEGYFSWSPCDLCDLCDTNLGGQRYDYLGLRELGNLDTADDLSICVNCMLAIET